MVGCMCTAMGSPPRILPHGFSPMGSPPWVLPQWVLPPWVLPPMGSPHGLQLDMKKPPIFVSFNVCMFLRFSLSFLLKHAIYEKPNILLLSWNFCQPLTINIKSINLPCSVCRRSCRSPLAVFLLFITSHAPIWRIKEFCCDCTIFRSLATNSFISAIFMPWAF